MALNRQQFYTALFFLAPLLIFSLRPISTEDLAIWVALGRDALREGRLILADTYSVFPARPMIYPAGAPLLYGALHGVGGLGLVVLAHRLCLLAVLVLIYRQSLGKLRWPWSGVNVLWAGFMILGIAFGLVERPSILAVLPFVLALRIILTPEVLRAKQIGGLALLAIVWVNLHGSFVILPALVGWRLVAWFLSRRPQWSRVLRDLLAFLAVSAGTLINPFGYRIYPYVLETAQISRARMEEWQPSSLTAFFPQGLLFFLLVAVLIALVATKKIEARRFLRSPMVPLLVLGASGIRHTDLCFYALLPFLASFGMLREARVLGIPKRANGVIVAVLAVLCLASSPWWKPGFLLPPNLQALYSETAPAELVALIAASEKPGAVFHHHDFGSFLALTQGRKLFLDSRNIIFTDADLEQYRRILHAEGDWRELIDRYQVRFALLKTGENKALRSALLGLGWQERGEARGAVLLERGE